MMTEENKNTENNIELQNLAEPAQSEDVNLNIGDLIRNKREEKGLSLKVISQQTKIHIGLLESLEANQFEKLPSKAYVRGFVKSTAKILGIEQELALHLLDLAYSKNESKIKQPVASQEIKAETARNTLTTMTETPLEAVKSVTASSTVFLAKATAVILIVGIVGFNIKNFMEKSTEDTEVKLPEVLTTTNKKKAPAPKPVVKAEPVEVKPEEPIQVNLIQDKNQKVDVTVNDINLATISLGEKQFAEEKMEKEKMDELLPAKYRIQPVKGVETIFLNASEGDSWLTYKVDDKEIKKFVLRQGRTLFLRGSLIRLFIGNTKSLSAFYNNKPVNLSPGSKGGVKNIVLPEELKTKYMAPLFVFLDDGTVVTSDEYLKSNQNKATPTSTTTTTPAPAPATEGAKVVTP